MLVPVVVLLDVVLPGQNWLSFLQWMREQGSEVPVLGQNCPSVVSRRRTSFSLSSVAPSCLNWQRHEQRNRAPALHAAQNPSELVSAAVLSRARRGSRFVEYYDVEDLRVRGQTKRGRFNL